MNLQITCAFLFGLLATFAFAPKSGATLLDCASALNEGDVFSSKSFYLSHKNAISKSLVKWLESGKPISTLRLPISELFPKILPVLKKSEARTQLTFEKMQQLVPKAGNQPLPTTAQLSRLQASYNKHIEAIHRELLILGHQPEGVLYLSLLDTIKHVVRALEFEFSLEQHAGWMHMAIHDPKRFHKLTSDHEWGFILRSIFDDIENESTIRYRLPYLVRGQNDYTISADDTLFFPAGAVFSARLTERQTLRRHIEKRGIILPFFEELSVSELNYFDSIGISPLAVTRTVLPIDGNKEVMGPLQQGLHDYNHYKRGVHRYRPYTNGGKNFGRQSALAGLYRQYRKHIQSFPADQKLLLETVWMFWRREDIYFNEFSNIKYEASFAKKLGNHVKEFHKRIVNKNGTLNERDLGVGFSTPPTLEATWSAWVTFFEFTHSRLER